MKYRLVQAAACCVISCVGLIATAAVPAGLGTSKANAIEVCKPDGERAYLQQLACPDASVPKISRNGSVGERNPDPNRTLELGGGVQDAIERLYKPLKAGQIDSHTVDAYKVMCGTQEMTIYLDMYHCEQTVPVAAPSGLLGNGRSAPETSTSDELVVEALKCSDFDECLGLMLRAADPRKPEAIQVAAVRISELNRAQGGNRKVARQLNSKGLGEFKKGNLDTAVALLQQAASADSSDVEIQANLGLMLLRASRPKEAQLALSLALRINPRRTNTWVPLAEYFSDSGESKKAIASLQLAYEFSESKEKTRTFFEDKAKMSDSYATLYGQAYKKLPGKYRSDPIEEPVEQRTSSMPSPGIGDDWITKDIARSEMLEMINADSSANKDQAAKEMLVCFMNEFVLNNVFPPGVKRLARSIYESKVKAEAMNAKTDQGQLVVIRCMVNSKTFEQIAKNDAQNSGATLPKTPTQLPTMDMVDLRLDFASLSGRKVRVKAIGYYVMNMFVLKGDPMDMSPIIVDTSKVPREQQRRILQSCGDIMNGCRVTVSGTVGKVSYQNGIVAEMVEW